MDRQEHVDSGGSGGRRVGRLPSLLALALGGLLLLPLSLLSPSRALAAGCVVINGEMTCPLATGEFDWVAGVGGAAATTYTVKCAATKGGPYSLFHAVAAPALLEPVKNVISVPGKYWCIATASDTLGESPSSNEVTFTAIVPPPAVTPLILQ